MIPILIPPALLFYTLYSTGVAIYANRRVRTMSSIPPLWSDDHANMTEGILSSTTPDSLRSTISRRTQLVENPVDRRVWNAWCCSASSPPSSSCLCPAGTSCASYTFAYRSYVNYEEECVIGKSLLSFWHMLRLVQMGKGRMTFSLADNKNTRRMSVSNSEFFRMFLFLLPVKITWNGYVEEVKANQQRGCHIVWTDTEMTIRSPIGPWKKKILNPALSEKLRVIPWDVIKEENGLVAFKRGDVGVLVYDRDSVME